MKNQSRLFYLLVISAFFTQIQNRSPAFGEALESVAPPDMALIPGGPFEMGCDDLLEQNRVGRRTVEVAAFYMDLTEVTNTAYEKFFPDHHTRRHPTSSCDDCPVTKLSWYDARAYCQSLGKDLPTEAQWEKAAGASDSCAYSWDGPVNETPEQMKMSSLARGGFSLDDGTSRVASYPPNRFGLFDMVGNVWEWTNEKLGPFRIRRGGAWSDDIRGLRVSWRDWSAPETSFFVDVGFRCAKN